MVPVIACVSVGPAHNLCYHISAAFLMSKLSIGKQKVLEFVDL